MLCNYVKPLGFISSAVLVSMVAGVFLSSGIKADEAPVMALGWNWRVFQSGLRLVDNIVVAENNTLYATLERSPGRGQLVTVTNGRVSVLVDGLDRPDGLAMAGDTLYVTRRSLTVEFSRIS